MPAWLTATATRPRPRRWPGSRERPVRNMKTSSPSWPREPTWPRTSGGRRYSLACGQIPLSRDGPSRMPATISPMTAGCPSRRAAAPPRWQTMM